MQFFFIFFSSTMQLMTFDMVDTMIYQPRRSDNDRTWKSDEKKNPFPYSVNIQVQKNVYRKVLKYLPFHPLSIWSIGQE